MRRFFTDRAGATAIEFAVAASALLALVLGAEEYGRMLWTQQVLQGAASVTARCLSIGSASCPSAGTYAANIASQRGVGDLSAGNVTVAASSACGGVGSNFTQVTITYSFAAVVPALVPGPASTMTASACYPN
jgi:Flp pilus assembly protein TadG